MPPISQERLGRCFQQVLPRCWRGGLSFPLFFLCEAAQRAATSSTLSCLPTHFCESAVCTVSWQEDHG